MNTLDTVKKILSEYLSVPTDKIDLKSNLKEDLKADSLDLVELLMGFEEEFNVVIDSDDVASLQTVEDIVNYIENNK